MPDAVHAEYLRLCRDEKRKPVAQWRSRRQLREQARVNVGGKAAQPVEKSRGVENQRRV